MVEWRAEASVSRSLSHVGGQGVGFDLAQDADDGVDLDVWEEVVRAGRGVVGVGRLEEASRLDDALWRPARRR